MIAQVCHLPFYLSDQRCNVVSIYETRNSLVNYFNNNFRNLKIINNYKNIIDDSDIDAVIICMPRETNSLFGYEAVIAKKAIHIEKPMAYSLEDAIKIHDQVVKNNIKFGIGYMKRHDPGLIKAKNIFHETIKSKVCGTLEKIIFYNNYNKYEFKPPAHKKPDESRNYRYPTWSIHPNYIPKDLRTHYADFINIGVHNINLINFFLSSSEINFEKTKIDYDKLFALMNYKGVPVELKFTKSNQINWSEGIRFIFSDGSIEVLIPCPMNQKGISKIFFNKQGKKKQIKVRNSLWQFEIQAKNFISSLFNEDVLASNSYTGVEDMRLVKKIWSSA